MNIKVLHISTYDYKGEGIAALRIHKALLASGIESYMLVSHKRTDCESVFVASTYFKTHKYIEYSNPIKKWFHIIRRSIGIGVTYDEKIRIRLHRIQKKHPVLFSLPISSYRLEKHPLIEKADIIHLHSIRDFVDFKTFFKHISKPIVWTFHDLNPLYGGFHLTIDKNINYKFYQKFETKALKIKQKSINNNNNITIIAISSSMLKEISQSELYRKKPIFLVHNCVDGSKFQIINKLDAKKELGIDANQKVILFLCESLNIKAKGFDILIEALKSLYFENILLLCVGNGIIPSINNINIEQYPPTYDSKRLSLYYSAADLYIQPSIQESFGQTVIEAMCCGTPVVMTQVGIASELINDCNGIICRDFSSESLCEAIRISLNRIYDYDKIRKIILQEYSPEKTALKYISIYNNII